MAISWVPLRSAAEDGAAAGIVAEEFEKESGDAVEEEIGAENLAVEFFAGEHPGKDKEDGELDGGFE